MEMHQLYDEDLLENKFFQQFCDMCSSLFHAAVENEWMICVPKVGTFEDHTLTELDCMSHVLIEVDTDQYRTASDKHVSIKEKVITLGEGFENATQVQMLFSETFYTDSQKKYQVWCVDKPLSFECSTPLSLQQLQSATEFRVLTVEDSIDLLFTGQNCSLKKTIDKMISTHKPALSFSDKRTQSLRDQIDTMHSLFTKCLQASSKDSQLKRRMSLNKHIADNLRVSVETYINDKLFTDLFKYICTAVASEDAQLNKINRNLSQIQLKDLGIVSEFRSNVPKARRELLEFVSQRTPIAKMISVKKIITALMQSPRNAQELEPLTADDLIPMLVFLIVQSSIPNWSANFEYMTQFHFSKSYTDEYSFYLSTLEAAIFYIKSGELNKLLSADSSKKPIIPSRAGSPYSKTSQMDILFEHIRCGDVDQVRNVLEQVDEAEAERVSKCHPLCSCDLCEKGGGDEDSPHRAHVTVFSRDDRGYTAMHQAALYGQAEVIEFLKSCGGLVSATDYHSSTPLHVSCQKGHQSAVMILIDCGADVNAADNDGNRPLHLATLNGHEDCVKALIYQSLPNTLDINVANERGDTALHLAAKWSYETITDLLLEHGAWPEARNRRNATPMMLVSHGAIAQLLTNAIKMSQQRANDGFIDVSQMHSATPPVYEPPETQSLSLKPAAASQSKVSKKVQKFLRAVSDSDVNMMKHLMGWSEPEYDSSDVTDDDEKELCHPLCQCKRCAPTQKKQASIIDINAGDEQGRTALHIAVERSNVEIISLLLEKHLEVNCKTNLVQFTPLHIACQQLTPHKETVEMLIKHGAKVNCKDCNGRTPLHFSSQTGSVAITQLLLESDANIDVMNIRGNTPLHEACKVNNTEIVHLLLHYRANPTLTNKNGLTAIQLTSNSKIIQVITYALDRWREQQAPAKSCQLPTHVTPVKEQHTSAVAKSDANTCNNTQRQHLFAALEANDQQKLKLLFSSIGSFNRSSLRRTITRDRSSPLLNIDKIDKLKFLSSKHTADAGGYMGKCVPDDIHSSGQSIEGDIHSSGQSIAGDIHSSGQSIAGDIYSTGQCVGGDIHSTGQSIDEMATNSTQSLMVEDTNEPPECDFHLNLHNQTECENSETESVDGLMASQY